MKSKTFTSYAGAKEFLKGRTGFIEGPFIKPDLNREYIVFYKSQREVSGTMKKKSDVVRELIAAGNYKKALSIAKGFKLGFTKEEQDTLTRAHECLVHPGWYEQLGINEEKVIEDGIAIIKRVYGE